MPMSDEEHLQQQAHDDQQECDENNNNANIIKENKHSFQLFYRVFRPITTSNKHAPLIVISGGPSMPQEHLLGLVGHVPYSNIMFISN